MALKSKINHLNFLIHNFEENLEIYRKCFDYLGYEKIMDSDGFLAFNNPNDNISIWIMSASTESENDRDSNGLNHLGIGVDSKEEVNKFVEEFLKPNNIECLFETPRTRPEFAGETGDYYQVMFQLPGTLLFEVMFYKN